MSQLKEAGFGVVNLKFRDTLIKELLDYRQQNSKLYIDLEGWKEAKLDGIMRDIIEVGKKVLTDVF